MRFMLENIHSKLEAAAVAAVAGIGEEVKGVIVA